MFNGKPTAVLPSKTVEPEYHHKWTPFDKSTSEVKNEYHGLRLWKRDNRVFISGLIHDNAYGPQIDIDDGYATYEYLFTLPEGYRPTRRLIRDAIGTVLSNGRPDTALVWFHPDGMVRVIVNRSVTMYRYISFNTSFVI